MAVTRVNEATCKTNICPQNAELNKVRLYCTGENLCFWSARKGLDPRYSYSSMSSQNVYSPVRTVMGGVQVTF